MKTTEGYTFFWTGPFSQWAPCKFVISNGLCNIDFNCAEQWMMYAKAQLFGDTEIANKILLAAHPREQKALGRQIKGFNKEIWDKYCEEIVFLGNWAKFTQSARLKAELIKTEGELVEASPDDSIWGIGMAEDNPDLMDFTRWGENKLGKVLTKVRNLIKIVGE